ncbi:MAG: hypothetical protein MUC87_00790 [Bacteroidia bacterium]|jgi:hypothetical protein|nr:hypothetical protein [Bacteroidia bacterium]
MISIELFTGDHHASYIVGYLLGFALIFVLPYIFYLLQVQRLLRLISPDLRRMEPDQAWLLLIPVFRLVWSFIVVTRIGDSLRAEHQRRGILEFDERPGFAIGMAMASAGALYNLVTFADVKVVSGVLLIAMLSCWIVYWVKLAGFERQLKQSGMWQQYSAAANPYYQQAWPAPQWEQQNAATQHDWQRQGMGQHWQNPYYPPATQQPPPPQYWPQQGPPPPQQPGWNQPPPQQPNWNQPPPPPVTPPPTTQSPWQPPAQNPPSPPPPPTDPNDLSRWMPPGNNQ